MKQIAAICVVLLAFAGAVRADQARVITVVGHGTVERVPDMATVRLGVTREAKQAGDAMAAVSGAVADVLSRLKAAGIEARDVQTQALSLQPVWNNSSTPQDRRITGFVARNMLAVRVRELDRLGDILSDVLTDGANTFNGLQFSVAEPDAVMSEARTKAVADARTKAEELASAAGVTLGPVVTITEVSRGAPRPVMMEMSSRAMADSVPVAEGEISLSAQVSIVFSIADE